MGDDTLRRPQQAEGSKGPAILTWEGFMSSSTATPATSRRGYMERRGYGLRGLCAYGSRQNLAA